jgi:hypothetical protein
MSSFLGFAALAGIVGLGGGGDPASPSEPIYIVAEPSSSGLSLSLIGASDRPYEARYRLEVNSDVLGGGNRSSQSGRVTLSPGQTVTLVSVSLGNASLGKWEARLYVEPVNEPPYERVQTNL